LCAAGEKPRDQYDGRLLWLEREVAQLHVALAKLYDTVDYLEGQIVRMQEREGER
jgi:hypothetical protein